MKPNRFFPSLRFILFAFTQIIDIRY